MATYGPFTFATQTGADADRFLYTDPVATNATLPQAANTGRRWCWDNNDTSSTDVGPTSGQSGNPEGYLYTEASSPAAFNDVFILTFDTALDAAAEQWQMTFYTNQRGDDNDVTCQVQINENNAGWINVGSLFGGTGDPNKVDTGGTQIWALRSVDLSAGGTYTNASTQVRLLLTFPASGTSWNNDYGIDTITFTGTPNGPPTEIRETLHDVTDTVYSNGTVVHCCDASGNVEYSGTVGTVTGVDTSNPAIGVVGAGEVVFTFANGDTAQRYLYVDPSEDANGLVTNLITPTQLV